MSRAPRLALTLIVGALVVGCGADSERTGAETPAKDSSGRAAVGGVDLRRRQASIQILAATVKTNASNRRLWSM